MAEFGPEKVKKAIKDQTIAAKKKHLLLSRVASPDARGEIKRVRGWDLWDQVDITRVFRTLPKREQVRIADIYFPTQRFALTGELAAGPWQTVEAFFAPQLVEGRVFNQRWELVGRITELNGLARAFADPSVLAVSLIGRAGDGKSRVLRTALDGFASQYPGIRVVVASPTEEISAKSLEDLGPARSCSLSMTFMTAVIWSNSFAIQPTVAPRRVYFWSIGRIGPMSYSANWRATG